MSFNYFFGSWIYYLSSLCHILMYDDYRLHLGLHLGAADLKVYVTTQTLLLLLNKLQL